MRGRGISSVNCPATGNGSALTRAGTPPQCRYFGSRLLLLFRRRSRALSLCPLVLGVARLSVHFIRDRERCRVQQDLRELPLATAPNVVGNEAREHRRKA